jgi:hypothetical protein
VSYAGNDTAATALINGMLIITGDQPFSPNSLNMSGATGGIEAGYNWQFDRTW